MNILINFASMVYFYSNNSQLVINNFTNQSIVSNTISSKFFQISRKSFSQQSKVFNCQKTLINKVCNSAINFRIRIFEIFVSSFSKFQGSLSGKCVHSRIALRLLHTEWFSLLLFQYVGKFQEPTSNLPDLLLEPKEHIHLWEPELLRQERRSAYQVHQES